MCLCVSVSVRVSVSVGVCVRVEGNAFFRKYIFEIIVQLWGKEKQRNPNNKLGYNVASKKNYEAGEWVQSYFTEPLLNKG